MPPRKPLRALPTDSEAAIGGFSASNRKIDWRAAAHQVERRGDVRQHTGLRWNIELCSNFIQHRQQSVRPLGIVGRRIDPDDGVAGAEHQAIEDARGGSAEPRHGSAPAKRARPSNASSIRSASFHFAMRSERENEPTLS